jgi:methyl-accepting chemotaxis protein
MAARFFPCDTHCNPQDILPLEVFLFGARIMDRFSPHFKPNIVSFSCRFYPKEVLMVDRFNLSGDFRGAIVNIKSTLTNVQQSVGEIRTDDQNARKELEKLIGQLSDALQKVPEKSQEHAEAVAETAKMLVETAKAEKPNKAMVQITGEGLKRAAQNLADVLPTVVTIAGQIVMAVTKLVGM